MQHRVCLLFFLLLTFSQEILSAVGTGRMSYSQTVTREVCILPVEKGSCEGKLQRWFYNMKTHKCEMFQYGGCNGNGNNFVKRDICKRYCQNV